MALCQTHGTLIACRSHLYIQVDGHSSPSPSSHLVAVAAVWHGVPLFVVDNSVVDFGAPLSSSSSVWGSLDIFSPHKEYARTTFSSTIVFRRKWVLFPLMFNFCLRSSEHIWAVLLASKNAYHCMTSFPFSGLDLHRNNRKNRAIISSPCTPTCLRKSWWCN